MKRNVFWKKNIFLAALFLSVIAGCNQKGGESLQNADGGGKALAVAQGPTEDFEQGAKKGYASAPVALRTGEWELENALLDGDASDKKNGRRALRFGKEGTGAARMLFDYSGGVNKISVAAGLYGNDAPAEWDVRASTDGGKSWKTVSDRITARATLETFTFDAPFSGPVRFEVRKLSGGRLNIDDFSFNPMGGAPVADNTNNGGGTPNGTTGDENEDPLALGNPSGATADNPNNLLVKKKGIL